MPRSCGFFGELHGEVGSTNNDNGVGCLLASLAFLISLGTIPASMSALATSSMAAILSAEGMATSCVGLAASHLTRLPAGRNMASYLRFVGAEGADSEDVGGVREDPAASLEEIAMKASEKDGARKMQLV